MKSAYFVYIQATLILPFICTCSCLIIQQMAKILPFLFDGASVSVIRLICLTAVMPPQYVIIDITPHHPPLLRAISHIAEYRGDYTA